MLQRKKILDSSCCTAYIGVIARPHGMETEMIKSFEDVQAFGKDNMEACQASATALTKGFQTLAAETAEYSKRAFEKGAEAVEKIAGSKSPDKVFEVQQAYAQDAFEAFVGQATKIGELYVATAKEAFRPFEAKLTQFGSKAAK